jgi:hypothetical protein
MISGRGGEEERCKENIEGKEQNFPSVPAVLSCNSDRKEAFPLCRDGGNLLCPAIAYKIFRESQVRMYGRFFPHNLYTHIIHGRRLQALVP